MISNNDIHIMPVFSVIHLYCSHHDYGNTQAGTLYFEASFYRSHMHFDHPWMKSDMWFSHESKKKENTQFMSDSWMKFTKHIY
jgi:hypothetical protein